MYHLQRLKRQYNVSMRQDNLCNKYSLGKHKFSQISSHPNLSLNSLYKKYMENCMEMSWSRKLPQVNLKEDGRICSDSGRVKNCLAFNCKWQKTVIKLALRVLKMILPGRLVLSSQGEFTSVLSCGSEFVYKIPSENVKRNESHQRKFTPAGLQTGARISFRYKV